MTSEFLDALDVRQIGWRAGRPVWITLSPLRYRSALLDATVLVPAEFITDFASVPRWPLAWWLAGGRGPRSATLHDFPYQFACWVLDDGRRLPVEQDLADAVYHESLLADPISGAGPASAWLMHLGVRLGGRGVWRDRARTDALNPEWTAAGWPMEAA